jgi:hypothetical protein
VTTDQSGPLDVAALAARRSLLSVDDWIYHGSFMQADLLATLRCIRHFAAAQDGGEADRVALAAAAEQVIDKIGDTIGSQSYFLLRTAATKRFGDVELVSADCKADIKRWVIELVALVDATQRALRLMRTFGPTAERLGRMPRLARPTTPHFGNALEEAFSDARLRPPSPRTILVESTNRCNYRCVTCPQSENQKYSPFDFAWLELDDLRGIVADARVLHLAGRGEPLLSQAIWEFIGDALSGECHIGITTNGSMLHRLHIPPGQEQRFSIGLSFDGGRQETVEGNSQRS